METVVKTTDDLKVMEVTGGGDGGVGHRLRHRRHRQRRRAATGEHITRTATSGDALISRRLDANIVVTDTAVQHLTASAVTY